MMPGHLVERGRTKVQDTSARAGVDGLVVEGRGVEWRAERSAESAEPVAVLEHVQLS
jgi:hypothetical protein